MIIGFDASDPFPFPPAGSIYAEAQQHAEAVDAWLGFKIREIERTLSEDSEPTAFPNEQKWIGLRTQALLTPYVELRQMLGDLKPAPGQLILDLGAGYGRLGLVLARHFPDAHFRGFEIVRDRVQEGNRVLLEQGAKNALLIEADISLPEFELPEADFYFLYDYGTRAAIEKTLEDLKSKASRHPITVIGRGRATRDAIEKRHFWLSAVISPLHRGNYSVYRSG